MSRLDRLVVLLETGSTVFIRNTAADQLADLAKGHPEESVNLLGRVYPFLKLPRWETRIAAARAFGGIVTHCPVWDPNDSANDKHDASLLENDHNNPSNLSSQSNTSKNGGNSKNPVKNDETTTKNDHDPSESAQNDVKMEHDEDINGGNGETSLKVDTNGEKSTQSQSPTVKQETSLNPSIKKEPDLDTELMDIEGTLMEVPVKSEPLDEVNQIKLEEQKELERVSAELGALVDFALWSLPGLLKSEFRLLASDGSTINTNDPQLSDQIEQTEESDPIIVRLKLARAAKRVKIESEEPVAEAEIKSELSNGIKSTNSDVNTTNSADSGGVVNSNPTTSGQELPPAAANMPSARLKAMQKRKAKAMKHRGTKPTQVDLSQLLLSRQIQNEATKSPTGTPTPEPLLFDITAQGSKLVMEAKAELSPLLSQHLKGHGMVWQFQGVYELLVGDLFDPAWEVRHGSALGLRELVRKHGPGAGRLGGRSSAENSANNQRTLVDLAVRICTLFALDRFGDYVSDTVVIPVRESAAQTLAALLLHLKDLAVVQVFSAIRELVLQQQRVPDLPLNWEVSHGGMLGLRYFVSVRTDVLILHQNLLDQVVEMVLHGLKERDDDVQAVAALTLTPIAAEFVRRKQDSVSNLLMVVWDCLINLKDDLLALIGLVMDLLAKLCTHREVLVIMEDELYLFELLVPRLYPFLRHSIPNVRKAVLRTLREFLSIGKTNWVDSRAMQLVFQNLLVEQNREVLGLSVDVYATMLKAYGSERPLEWLRDALTLIMTPVGIARHNYEMKTELLIRPSGIKIGDERLNKRKVEQSDSARINIDLAMYKGDVMLIGLETFIETRTSAARAFGQSLAAVRDLAVEEALVNQLTSPHSTPRLFAAIALQEFALHLLSGNDKIVLAEVEPLAKSVSIIQPVLESPERLPHFRELVPTLKAVRTACLQLFNVFVEVAKVSPSSIPQLPIVIQGNAEAGKGAFGIDNAKKILNETYDKLVKSLSPTYRMGSHTQLEDAKHRIILAINEAERESNSRVTSILATWSAVSLTINGVPKKLNPVIRSLMDAVKLEELPTLQKRSANATALLIKQLIGVNKIGAVNKLIKNLCGFLCVDTLEVPEFRHNIGFKDQILSLKKEEAKTDPVDIAEHEKATHEAKIKRNGAVLAFDALLELYGANVFESVPKLKELMIEPIGKMAEVEHFDSDGEKDQPTIDAEKGQQIIDALGIVRALIVKLDSKLQQEIVATLPRLLPGIKSKYSIFRYSSAKCLATIASVCPTQAFVFIVEDVLPLLGGEVFERQGAVECIYHLSSTMGGLILPYIVFLIVPVLGRMSDADMDTRVLATTTFALIIKLVPLEAGIPDPEDMPEKLLVGRDRERDFIQQMMDPLKIKSFDLPVEIKATLRKYQQEGVNWLAFLNKYHLHGILCDDMGLGKTLQTLCIIASDHYMRAEEHKKTGSKDSRKIPTLIVCPPSLTGHWEQEINQYAPFLSVLVYAGGPSIRSSLRGELDKADIVVTSYDVCRNDVEYLSALEYNYCVLDEGHIIKNAASKLTKSVKKIQAEHRLILSGTPIQNNVLELWSLFDFLMPGFLGTEKIFHEKFAKPIAASRNGKTSSKEQEAGALALELLHKQVLPFMLRRLKEDVLLDLPPKIIQDYYCELSDLQRLLYKDFATKQKDSVREEVKSGAQEKTHVFQALQYMRKLCNHPLLVLSPDHPKYAEVMQKLARKRQDIKLIDHSPKLLSLKNLLLECGIGIADQKEPLSGEGVISEHRALIFCQLKDMLDIVENDLLKKYLPLVTYMRLDGLTEARDRQLIVRKFNEDPLIDVLLLTTKVGGLGLNLTGADTVIFVEHDWNPMNDLQAMDRAHRLGQKRVVNVYRLITKNTLEEKIMGLQKFKMNIALTIVNQQNAGLALMDTNQLLDLFDVDDSARPATQMEEEPGTRNVEQDVGAGGLTGKAAGAVGELSELWDELQYEEEYNLDNFIKTLK